MILPNEYSITPKFDNDFLNHPITSIYVNNHEQLDLEKYTVYDHEVIFDYQNYTSYEIKESLYFNKNITVYLKDYNKALYKKLPRNIANGPFLIIKYNNYDFVRLSNKEVTKGCFYLKSYIDPSIITKIPYKLSKDISDKGIISRIYSCDRFNIYIRPNVRYVRFKNTKNTYCYYDGLYRKFPSGSMVIIKGDAKLYNLNEIIKDKYPLKIKYNTLTRNIKFKDQYGLRYWCHNNTNYIHSSISDIIDIYTYGCDDYRLSKPLYYDTVPEVAYVPLDFFEEFLDLEVKNDKINNTITIYFKD